MRNWRAGFILHLWAIGAGVLAGMLPGCSRYDYVRDADDQAYRLVSQKSNNPRWAQPAFRIDLDPRSRYFDPYDDISPPMPPDDPASHRFMEYVDSKKHWSYWNQFGIRPNLENSSWREELEQYVEFTDDGKVKLGLEDAVRLALIHQPDYQQNLETLYLSALDVSTERFRFDTQFFGTVLPLYRNTGPLAGQIVQRPNQIVSKTLNSTSQWDNESTLTAQRQLSTAGQLLVGFANSTVWELVGRNTDVSTSVLNFSFVQPLLRAGGRAIALEQLTIVERALLANLRALERYRRGFFTNIAVGTDGTRGPSRRGGFFGGTGLTGFTGTGSGGFGGVGAITGFGGGFGGGGAGGTGGGAGTTGFAGGGAGNVGGYFGLLQRIQQIRNSQQTLELQLTTLELLEDLFKAGSIDRVQVDQFRQNVETERATLLQAQISFQDSLENFLVNTLGLPPELPVELKEGFIEPLRFTTGEMLNVQNQLVQIFTDFGNGPPQFSVEEFKAYFERAAEVFREADGLAESIREDLKKLDERAETRKVTMTETEKKLFDEERQGLEESLQETVEQLKTLAATLDGLKQNVGTANPKEMEKSFVQLVKNMQDRVGSLFQIQAQARLESLTVEEVSLDPQKALQIARTYRLDWMNNRAALVDTWRLIQFNANALKSNLSLRFDGNMSTIGGDNPFKFRDESGTVRASVQFDPPFTRLVERNNFRQQLITYQQSRRQLIQFRDGVYFNLRQILRSIKQLRVNLEIQRRAVAIAIRRVELTRAYLNQPPGPAPIGATQAPSGALESTASLNLLNALSDLRNTQNNFLSVYLNYYAARMLLIRELGLMRLDENGVWVDEPLDLALAQIQQLGCENLPPEIPDEWLSPKQFPDTLLNAIPEGLGVGMPELTPPPAPGEGPALPNGSAPASPDDQDEKPRAPSASALLLPAPRSRGDHKRRSPFSVIPSRGKLSAKWTFEGESPRVFRRGAILPCFFAKCTCYYQNC